MTKQILVHIGEEGDRQDPWMYTEYSVVDDAGNELTMRDGMAVSMRYNDKTTHCYEQGKLVIRPLVVIAEWLGLSAEDTRTAMDAAIEEYWDTKDLIGDSERAFGYYG